MLCLVSIILMKKKYQVIMIFHRLIDKYPNDIFNDDFVEY